MANQKNCCWTNWPVMTIHNYIWYVNLFIFNFALIFMFLDSVPDQPNIWQDPNPQVPDEVEEARMEDVGIGEC